MEQRDCCIQSGHRKKQIARPDRLVSALLLTDQAIAALKAKAPLGCLLCLIEHWEEDWDA